MVSLATTDAAGNTGSASMSVDVDNVAPQGVAITGPASGSEAVELTFAGTATDPAGSNDVLTYAWSVTKNGAACGTGLTGVNETAFSFTPDDDGEYVVSLTVSDEDGGSTTATHAVSVANADPSASVAVTAGVDGVTGHGTEGTAITLAATASDPAGPNDTLSYGWTVTKDGVAYPVAGNTADTFTFTPDDNAAYVVTLVVSDEDGGEVAVATPITVDNADPAVTVSGPTTGVEGDLLSFTSTASDPAGGNDTLSYAWSVTKDGITYDPGTAVNGSAFSFTPADNGTYVVTLLVSDGEGGTGTASQAVDVTTRPRCRPSADCPPATPASSTPQSVWRPSRMIPDRPTPSPISGR